MKPEEMKLLCDEHISDKICDLLREYTFKDVKSIREIGMRGYNDGKIFNFAKENNWLVITYDKKFAKKMDKYGVEYIHTRPLIPGKKGLIFVGNRSQKQRILKAITQKHKFKELKRK